jgi:hypothetical protein
MEQRIIAGTSAYICNKTTILCTGENIQVSFLTDGMER